MYRTSIGRSQLKVISQPKSCHYRIGGEKMIMELNFIGDELDVRMLAQNFDVNSRKLLTRTIRVGKDLYQIDHKG